MPPKVDPKGAKDAKGGASGAKGERVKLPDPPAPPPADFHPIEQPRPFLPAWSDKDAAAEAKKDKPQFDDPDGNPILPADLQPLVSNWARISELYAKFKDADVYVNPPAEHAANSRFTHGVQLASPAHAHNNPLSSTLLAQLQLVMHFQEQIPHGGYLWENIYPCPVRVKPDQLGKEAFKPQFNPAGRYLVKLFVHGRWRKVIIDDQIPVDAEGNSLLPVSSAANEVWPLIVGKALIKAFSGQPIHSGGIMFFHALTGWMPTTTTSSSSSSSSPSPASWLAPITSHASSSLSSSSSSSSSSTNNSHHDTSTPNASVEDRQHDERNDAASATGPKNSPLAVFSFVPPVVQPAASASDSQEASSPSSSSSSSNRHGFSHSFFLITSIDKLPTAAASSSTSPVADSEEAKDNSAAAETPAQPSDSLDADTLSGEEHVNQDATTMSHHVDSPTGPFYQAVNLISREVIFGNLERIQAHLAPPPQPVMVKISEQKSESIDAELDQEDALSEAATDDGEHDEEKQKQEDIFADGQHADPLAAVSASAFNDEVFASISSFYLFPSASAFTVSNAFEDMCEDVNAPYSSKLYAPIVCFKPSPSSSSSQLRLVVLAQAVDTQASATKAISYQEAHNQICVVIEQILFPTASSASFAVVGKHTVHAESSSSIFQSFSIDLPRHATSSSSSSSAPLLYRILTNSARGHSLCVAAIETHQSFLSISEQQQALAAAQPSSRVSMNSSSPAITIEDGRSGALRLLQEQCQIFARDVEGTYPLLSHEHWTVWQKQSFKVEPTAVVTPPASAAGAGVWFWASLSIADANMAACTWIEVVSNDELKPSSVPSSDESVEAAVVNDQEHINQSNLPRENLLMRSALVEMTSPVLLPPNEEGYTVVVSSFCPASLARAPAGKYSLRLFAVGASPSASSEPHQQQQPSPIHSLQPEPINVVSEYSDGYQRNVNRVLFREVLTNPAAAGHTSFSLQASFSCPTTGLVLSVTDEETKQLLSQSAALGAVIVANALMKKGKRLVVECRLDPLCLGDFYDPHSPEYKDEHPESSASSAAADAVAAPPASARGAAASDNASAFSWKLKVVSGAQLTLTKDQTKETQFAEIKANWEKTTPGRAQKAKASRDKYLASLSSLPHSLPPPSIEQLPSLAKLPVQVDKLYAPPSESGSGELEVLTPEVEQHRQAMRQAEADAAKAHQESATRRRQAELESRLTLAASEFEHDAQHVRNELTQRRQAENQERTALRQPYVAFESELTKLRTALLVASQATADIKAVAMSSLQESVAAVEKLAGTSSAASHEKPQQHQAAPQEGGDEAKPSARASDAAAHPQHESTSFTEHPQPHHVPLTHLNADKFVTEANKLLKQYHDEQAAAAAASSEAPAAQDPPKATPRK